MRMFRSLLLAGVAAAALSACAQEEPLHYVGTPLLLPDGHSSEGLLAGGVCADPKCWTQDTVTGGVHTHWVRGRLVSDVHDLRPVTAPAAGYALAQMAVPAAINAAGTIGAGAIVAHSVQMAGAYQGEGTYAAGKATAKALVTGDGEIGKGIASAKPAVNINNNINKPMTMATATSASTSAAAASSTARLSAVQQNVNNNKLSQSQLQAQGFFLNPAYVPGTKQLP